LVQNNKTEQPKPEEKKTKEKPKKTISFGAGLSLNQQLPINGQKLTPYSSSGRKGSLGDYIPSVYFRMYKEQRWFLQSEFRYGAPQYTKEFTYKQKITIDTFNQLVTTTSNRLKKTFYHQLPVSFNYFVRPNWSVGTGLVWNKFKGAIYDKETRIYNNNTQTDSLVAKGIANSSKADSNFKKSYFQAVFESQYKWKRFSFGARYAVGIQPYIKFTLPGGTTQEEKNSSINLFIRYELWNSRRK